MMGKLPYAIMCALRELAGERPSTNFTPIGYTRPDPEAMQTRRAYLRPLAPPMALEVPPSAPESKYEYSASLQDLVDFGLIKHGFWHEGERPTTTYGFHLTEKAIEALSKAKEGGSP